MMISPGFSIPEKAVKRRLRGHSGTVYVAEEKRFRVEGATLVPVVMETTAA
jgi:hypothetical protein